MYLKCHDIVYPENVVLINRIQNCSSLWLTFMASADFNFTLLFSSHKNMIWYSINIWRDLVETISKAYLLLFLQ